MPQGMANLHVTAPPTQLRLQFYTSRQKITLKSEKKPLQDDAKVKDVGLGNGGDLDIKDLGPQLGWKFVFVVEYVCSFLI